MKELRLSTRRTRRLWPGLLAGLVAVALLAATACGSGAAEAPGSVPEDEGDRPAEDVGVRFVDVTAQAGIVFSHFNDVRTSVLPEDMGSGMAWGDYDEDGFVDLFIVNASRHDQGQRAIDRGKLFRNLGDGTFEDVTEDSGIRQTGLGMGAVWFDYDGDDDIDLFITGVGWQQLYGNTGDGVFEDVTQESGLNINGGWPAGPAVADYDLDGDLDLYVPHYVDFRYDGAEDGEELSQRYGLDTPFTLNPASYDPLPNALYRNNGDGTFTETGESAGVANPLGRSLQAVFSDFNFDGLPDLYVANDISNDALFINGGDGAFEDAAIYAGTADARGSVGIAVGDYDADADPDLWVTHWVAQDDAFFRNMLDRYVSAQTSFIDQTGSVVGGRSQEYAGWGVGFIDYDNDGRLDVYIVNGGTAELPGDRTELESMPNLLFRNRAEGAFVLANAVAGEAWEVKNVGRGASYADYDNDGDLDIVILDRGKGVRLLQNKGGNQNNWLTFDLRGGAGNRQAVGATVTVGASGRAQRRVVVVGSSYLSMNDTRLHFGLGDAQRADWVEVRWPDGTLQRTSAVHVNQILKILK